MRQLTNFGASNEETESEIRVYAKKLSKICPFGNFEFWSKVNIKVKVNCPGKVNGYWSELVPSFRVRSRIEQ